MSMDPALLAQILGQQGGAQPPQGGITPQQSPLGTAADLTRKIMMMQQMQKPPQAPAPQAPSPSAIPGYGAPNGLSQDPSMATQPANLQQLLQNQQRNA